MNRSLHQPCNRDYEQYYLNQCGRGFPAVYGGVRTQQGHGLGNIIGGVLRTAIPLLKTGAKKIGKKALMTGLKVAGDIARGENVKHSLKKRSLEMIGIHQGSGNRPAKRRRTISGTGGGHRVSSSKGRGKTNRKTKNRKQNKVHDIFG